MFDLTADLYTQIAKSLYEKGMFSVSFNSYQVMCVQILYFLVLFVSSCLNLKTEEPISTCVFSTGDVILSYYFKIDCWHCEGSVWLG